MNRTDYLNALKEAESWAVTCKKAMVVIYRKKSDEFKHFDLDIHTRYENPDFHDLIVASVDHEGLITESAWIKAQLEAVAA